MKNTFVSGCVIATQRGCLFPAKYSMKCMALIRILNSGECTYWVLCFMRKNFSLNLFYSPIVCWFYIYKHILQFNTITCKQKGKRVEPQVLKRIYGSPHAKELGTFQINNTIELFFLMQPCLVSVLKIQRKRNRNARVHVTWSCLQDIITRWT